MNNCKDILDKVKKIHFIGIGGSGMSPLAEILESKGFEISGSDNYISDTLQKMIDNEYKIYTQHHEKNIDKADLIVYTTAVHENNLELIAARKSGLPIFERAEMLGILTSMYQNLIAVSGTHGKTTTTSMISQILMDANFDPTAIIGGKLNSINSNSKIGNSQTVVCEACEYMDAFLHLHPEISIITNIDLDHLDYFKNLDNVIKSFRKFIKLASQAVFINGDDENSKESIKKLDANVITFGFNKDNTYTAEILSKESEPCKRFKILKNNSFLCEIKLSILGNYNVYNALAAASVADFKGIPADIIKKSLNSFSGIHRRFELLGTPNNIAIIDDFAHHPTEVSAVLSSATKFGFKRVFAIFQPHTYSRTYDHLEGFAKSLSIADHVILSEILAVRENNVYNITSEDLAKKIKRCTYLKTFEEITDYIEKNALSGDLILTMGGGNAYVCANMILERLNKKYL